MHLRPAINPIIVRELHTRMRGVRPYLILTLFLLFLALTGLGIFQLMQQQARFGMTVLSAQVGQALFRGLTFVELLLVVCLAPALTSGAISGERERLTYDMLLATPLRPAQILWGKLVATLSYLFVLIFAAIPVFSVVLVFGGVEPKAMLKALSLLVATTVCFGAIGLCCSALLHSTARAMMLALLLVLLLVLVPLLASSVWGQFSDPPGQPVPPQLLYLNPFSALLAVTTLGGSHMLMSDMPMVNLGDPAGGLPLLGLLGTGVIHYGPEGVIIIPIYRATLLGYALLTTLLCWLSAHLVQPRQRWRLRWGDAGFGVLVACLLLGAWFSRAWWLILPPT
ncbi:MAG: ABC transporter permease [Candidatus Viridilinea halotolerans]|uniref:ABC transporter permease n=1 Tax=Candidatus Viridilinea halotolerans TaxID=2491704 RepID=A0A426TVB3_9CHLR|nr:MAG: ABC transporter permease [Candidatus Viridilinea halotolerans]